MNTTQRARDARHKYMQGFRRNTPEKRREYQVRFGEKQALKNNTSRKEGANDAKRQ